MNKKTVLIAGLVGTIAASIFGAAISIADINPIKTMSLNEASGAKVDRSLTVTNFVRNGFYVKKLSGGVSCYDDSLISFELSNPGAYGYMDLYPGNSAEITNIDDGLVAFTCDRELVITILFDNSEELYDSEEASSDEMNKLPIYSFGYNTVSSIIVKMGSRNVGAFQTNYQVNYDSDTNSYVISNLTNYSGINLRSTEQSKFFHIESITFNYNC